MNVRNLAITALATTGLCLGSLAQADLRFALGYPQGSIPAESAQVWADTLEEVSQGELTAKIYPLSLLNLMETSPGLRDGMADVGAVLTTYFMNEFPSTHMVTELTMMLDQQKFSGPHGAVFGGAVAEYVMLHCDECVEEFRKQNQVFTATGTTAPLPLLCNQPVRSLEDAEGMRLRGGGPQHSRWAQAIGASSVQMSVNEVYDALDQGVVDCTIQTATELTVFRLMEVVTDITVGAPGGGYGGTALANVNHDTWSSLSEHERTYVLKASAAMAADIIWAYHVSNDQNLEDAKNEGIQVHKANDDLAGFTRQFVRKDVEAIATNYAERYGLENTEDSIDKFQQVLERWIDLGTEMDSKSALRDLLWREIYSRVDVSSYAL